MVLDDPPPGRELPKDVVIGDGVQTGQACIDERNCAERVKRAAL